MESIVRIDGSIGEGGGQILRSALALSLVTGRPCRLDRIRARRKSPGLLRQHLTAVEAAAEVGSAMVEGADLGSSQLSFRPRSVRAGSFRYVIGTEGSTTLVLQTILPALMRAPGPSRIVLEGGTHNPSAPPFDFLDRALLPILNRMGPRIHARLERPGFYPAGDGLFSIKVEPAPRLVTLDLTRRGRVLRRRAVARVGNMPLHVGERQIAMVKNVLRWSPDCLSVEPVHDAVGPGNVLTLEIESEGITEIFTGFGDRGMLAHKVAEGVIREVRDYLNTDVPVGPYLADQLLVPFALAGGSSFRTLRPTRHTLTTIEIIKMFLGVNISVRKDSGDRWTIAIGSRG